MATSVDVLIAGGGPVGAFLRLSLGTSPLSVLHVDSAEPGADRPIALSHGSRLLLDRHDVFNAIENTPIKTIRVSQQGSFGRTLISADEYGLPGLGYVANMRSIRAALGQRVDTRLARVVSWSTTEEGVAVRISDPQGETQDFLAGLLVLADGAIDSASSGSANQARSNVTRDYHQCAVVAQVTTESTHHYTAHERFTATGPLAMLPNRDGFALVWCVSRDAAAGLLAMEDKSFLSSLGESFGPRLGKFLKVGPRSHFPLSLRFLRGDLGPRVVAIGNAAQSLHPVAGQGLNLGLRDARELAIALLDPRTAMTQSTFAGNFMQQRRADRRLEIGITDSLVRIFSRQGSVLGALRGAALLAVDALPPAKRLLARSMMYGLRRERRI